MLTVDEAEDVAVAAVAANYLRDPGKWILYAKGNPLDKFLLYLAYDAFHRLADFCGYDGPLFDRLCDEASYEQLNILGEREHSIFDPTRCPAVRRVASLIHESV